MKAENDTEERVQCGKTRVCSDHLQVCHITWFATHVDQGSVEVAHVGAAVTMTGVRSQLTHQLAVHCSATDHTHLTQGWTTGDVLEWSGVASVVLELLAEVGAPRVVAGAGGVDTGALVTLTTHGLRIAVC